MKTNLYGILLLSVVFSGCSGEKSEVVNISEPVNVKVRKVVTDNLAKSYSYSGTVEAENVTSLSFPVMGTIEKMLVEPGMRVSKGQLLATVNSASMGSSYKAAKSALEQAEDAYARMKELYDKGSLAEVKWVDVKTKLQQARAMEEMAKKNLEDCCLFAPFNGIISEKLAESGQNTAPGVPVVKIISGNEVNVKIAVPETNISNVALRQKAMVSVPAIGKDFEGTVVEKGVQANPFSRSYDVKISIANNGGELMAGMITDVVLLSGDTVTCHKLPVQSLLIDENNNHFVWISNNGKAEKRLVECSEFVSDGVIVSSGLKNGDEVIVEGQNKVCEGTSVSIK